MRRKERPAEERGDPYLIFRVRRDEYAMPAGRVHEIRTLPPAELPVAASGNSNHLLFGSISLHGRAIPVVDLALRFGHAPARRRARQVVIVLPLVCADGRNYLMGLLVDAVSKVVPIIAGRIGTADDIACGACTGRVRINGRFKYILDPDLLLSPEEMSATLLGLSPPQTESVELALLKV